MNGLLMKPTKMKMKKISSLISNIHTMIDYSFDDLQSLASVLDWPVNESRNINGTLSTKIFQSGKLSRFITHLPPKTGFPEHWHDCSETCTVLSGRLGDKTSKKTWQRNETAIFSRGQKHSPYNPDDTETCYLLVEFQH